MARRKGGETVGEVNGVAVADQAEAQEPQANTSTEGAEERAQPVHRIRIRNCSGAIWSNARNDGTTYLTFTVSRSYRDDQGFWHSSGSFGAPDGFLLAEVARQCALWIVNATQSDTVPF